MIMLIFGIYGNLGMFVYLLDEDLQLYDRFDTASFDSKSWRLTDCAWLFLLTFAIMRMLHYWETQSWLLVILGTIAWNDC